MRDRIYLVIGITCLCIFIPSWAQKSQPAEIRTVQPLNTLHVNIVGLPEAPLQNVFQRLNEKQEALKYDFTTQVLKRFYLDIPDEIRDGIKPYGYFKPKIRAQLTHQGRVWNSKFIVHPGPRLRFTSLDLQITGPGSNDPAYQHFYTNFPVKPGAYFNATQYKQAKQKLFQIAAAHGYFKAKLIKSAIYINLNTYTARVIIHFYTGPRYYFGGTTFTPTPFAHSFLDRFLDYKKGQHYDQTKVLHTREALANSNYFQQVIVTPEINKSSDNLNVPIKIDITPQLQKQYTFGVGYGSDTGARGSVDIDYRWINRYGHRFSAYLLGSSRNSNLSAAYYIPGSKPDTDQYIFTAGYLNQNQVTGQGQSVRFSATYQTVTLGWQQSVSLTYLRERYALTTLPNINSHLLFPTYTVQRISSDNRINPKNGYSIVGRVNGAYQNVLSSTSFAQGRIDTKFLFTLFNTTRFIFRATMGATAINNIVNLPLSLQFFAGGANSLRGFTYNSIGPGKYMFVGSAEIQQKIYGNIYLTGFIDCGNVSNNIFHDKLRQGVGPGLAWLSPVGMFEITVANAITQPNQPWVVQFSMGPAI